MNTPNLLMLPTRQEQVKSLAWKYFLKQKIEEVSKTYLMIGSFSIISVVWNFMEFPISFWWHIPFILWVINAAVYIIIGIVGWIKSNWETATRRAEDEIGVRDFAEKIIEND